MPCRSRSGRRTPSASGIQVSWHSLLVVTGWIGRAVRSSYGSCPPEGAGGCHR
jgi:hypothetical protein